MTEDKVRWDNEKELIPVRALRPQQRLPREVVAALDPWKVSKARLDGSWSNLA